MSIGLFFSFFLSTDLEDGGSGRSHVRRSCRLGSRYISWPEASSLHRTSPQANLFGRRVRLEDGKRWHVCGGSDGGAPFRFHIEQCIRQGLLDGPPGALRAAPRDGAPLPTMMLFYRTIILL
jgi:hypothetical protein